MVFLLTFGGDMKNDIMFQLRVKEICRQILHDKGKSKKVVVAEFNNRGKKYKRNSKTDVRSG